MHLVGETLAKSDGIHIAIFLSTLYSKLTGKFEQPTQMSFVSDNHSLTDALKIPKAVTKKAASGYEQHQRTHSNPKGRMGSSV